MGIKDLLGFKGEKGVDCNQDQDGVIQCRAMVRHKNNKFATGSEWNVQLDQNCRAHLTGRTSIFDDDEEIVKNSIKRLESDCRGGIN